MFSENNYRGNPVAVVLDADGLDDEQMQSFARWTNLSETTFVLTPTDVEADYRLRIFTPSGELPFAGHPTLGSCQAWIAASGATGEQFVQQCARGLVEVRRAGGLLYFAAPPLIRYAPVDEPRLEQLAQMLEIDRAEIVDAHWVDNGPGWVAVLLASSYAVLGLRPGLVDQSIGVAGRIPNAEEKYEVRAFFPVNGTTVEDPVTGSLNASLAQWLLDTGRVSAPYIARQGTAIGRDGRVYIHNVEGQLWVGGSAHILIEGSVEL